MLAALFATIAGDWPSVLAGAGIVGMWLRIEHRLTRIETLFGELPCKKEKPKPPVICL